MTLILDILTIFLFHEFMILSFVDEISINKYTLLDLHEPIQYLPLYLSTVSEVFVESIYLFTFLFSSNTPKYLIVSKTGWRYAVLSSFH